MVFPLARESAVWSDFALLDSGRFEKCERFGDVVMIRPEPQALWEIGSEESWMRRIWHIRGRGGRGSGM